MGESTNVNRQRRLFFADAARLAVAAGLALGGALLARRGPAGPSDQSCIQAGICRGCPRVRGCGLPQALSFRQVQARASEVSHG